MKPGQMTISYRLNGEYHVFDTYFADQVVDAYAKIGIKVLVTPF